jgi:hypothetical protein
MGVDMNIFDMADENSDSLKARYSSLRDKYEAQGNLGTLDEFAKLVRDEWTVSINMDLLAIYDFLVSGRCKNAHEVKEEFAEELGKYDTLKIPPVEEALKGHLKSYYKPRTVFDRAAENGEKFKYSALNIGGLGAYKYGEFCVVLERGQVEKYSSLAFIREDSLRYVRGNTVDNDRLGRDIANRECVHFLVVLKHQGDIDSIPNHKWPSIVCCSEEYTEAITADDILNTHIDVVRMSKEYTKPYFDDLLRYYGSELSDNSRKCELEVFRRILKLLNQQKIEREELDENGN